MAIERTLLAEHLTPSADGIGPGNLLECRGLTKDFGGVRAVAALDLSVQTGTVLGLIGPNGAGKSTALNLISGLVPPTAGTITYCGMVLRDSMASRARKGLVRTFQKGRLFTSMTALENIAAGVGPHNAGRLLDNLWYRPAARRNEVKTLGLSHALIELVGIRDIADEQVANLPFGQRRLVEFARALAARPRLLLLDEPAAGLNSSERQRLIELVRTIRDDFGVTVVLVEHDIGLVAELSNQIVVLHQGRHIASGAPSHVIADPEVRRAYLGTKGEAARA